MHELSIALSMLEQIEDETARHDGGKVEVVYVRIGMLSGVDAHALRYAFELACEGTNLAGSRLEIEEVPLKVYCPCCASIYNPAPQNILCPRCITSTPKIIEGNELELRALEIAA
jgi:hydrogenase nickel incorporation protein HypA/HybF